LKPVVPLSPSRHVTALGLLAWLTVGLAAGPPTALARLVIPDQDRAGETLRQLESAVLGADHRAMADLMSPAGVRLALGPDPQRQTELTPRQAFYYFKNLFQDRRTIAFHFDKHQEADGGRMHALAIWRFDSAETGGETRQRVMVTLEHGADGWKVVEITAWR